MKLMTEELGKKFEKYPLYSQDGKGENAEVVMKIFNPFGAGTWLITEGNYIQEIDDWELFGYMHIFEWEWGYVMLSELSSIGFLERDLYVEGKKVKELI